MALNVLTVKNTVFYLNIRSNLIHMTKYQGKRIPSVSSLQKYGHLGKGLYIKRAMTPIGIFKSTSVKLNCFVILMI